MGLFTHHRAWCCVAAAALCLGATAKAGDYYVYRSTDPAFRPGSELSGGDTVRLGPGGALVLVHATGSVVKLTGAAGPVRIPRHQPNPRDNPYPTAIRALLSPASGALINQAKYSSADIASCESGSARQVDGICRPQVKTRAIGMPKPDASATADACPAPAIEMAAIAKFVSEHPECHEAAAKAFDAYVEAQSKIVP